MLAGYCPGRYWTSFPLVISERRPTRFITPHRPQRLRADHRNDLAASKQQRKVTSRDFSRPANAAAWGNISIGICTDVQLGEGFAPRWNGEKPATSAGRNADRRKKDGVGCHVSNAATTHPTHRTMTPKGSKKRCFSPMFRTPRGLITPAGIRGDRIRTCDFVVPNQSVIGQTAC